MNEIEEKLKIKKWWEYLPIIGNMIFSMRIELYLNNIYLKDMQNNDLKQWRKDIKKYKSVFNITSLVISLCFIIPFFVLRNHDGYGSYPWFFWVSITIGIISNITPFISQFLYKKGYQKYLKRKMNNFKKL